MNAALNVAQGGPTDIVAMLVVKEAPIHSHQGVQDCNASVKWQLGDLSRW